MATSDRSTRQLVAAAVAAAVLALALLLQWRASCTFSEAPPGSGLLLCRGPSTVHGLVRVTQKKGWLFWGHTQVGPATLEGCGRSRAAARRAAYAELCRLPAQVHWALIGAGTADTLLHSGTGSLVRAVSRALRPAHAGAPPGQLDLIIGEPPGQALLAALVPAGLHAPTLMPRLQPGPCDNPLPSRQ